MEEKKLTTEEAPEAWGEFMKKADMKEALRELIMSAIEDARKTSGSWGDETDILKVKTLEALPEAIRVYLTLSEIVPDWSIEEMRSNRSL